jgi:hypothetical protein
MARIDCNRRGAILSAGALLLVAVSIVIPERKPVLAAGMMTDSFSQNPETRWRFLADTVMGGVSSGQLAFPVESGVPHARLTGDVRTANNGGFIQMRRSIAEPPPGGTRGVRLVVRGNGQRYFVHLRTRAAILPMQYYQAGFEVTQAWREVRLPFTSFVASGRFLPEPLDASGLTSIGIVAYGRDHVAEIEVREVGFY